MGRRKPCARPIFKQMDRLELHFCLQTFSSDEPYVWPYNASGSASEVERLQPSAVFGVLGIQRRCTCFALGLPGPCVRCKRGAVFRNPQRKEFPSR